MKKPNTVIDAEEAASAKKDELDAAKAAVSRLEKEWFQALAAVRKAQTDADSALPQCREVLPTLPAVDLVLTDPPYGIGADRTRNTPKDGWVDYGHEGWDKERPSPWLFGLMREKAKECVVWGGNYFTDLLPPSMRWLVWDKGQTDFSLADCEFAWSSQQGAARRLMLPRSEALKDGKERPTQKPVRLMVWCLEKHPKAQTVCDPFMGTGTTGVACMQRGLRFVGIERERAYFDIACRRIEQAQAQGSLLHLDSTPVAVQQVMEL